MRKLKFRRECAEPIEPPVGDLQGWLTEQARRWRLRYLLAHADDGVIWGRFASERWYTSHEAAGDEAPAVCPPLREVTLQEVRLFDEQAEILLWREEGLWRARILRTLADGEAAGEGVSFDQCFDEPQLLWGTHGRHVGDRFTLLQDGRQELRHAVPIQLDLDANGKLREPVRLNVRHFLSDRGFARVVASRLLGFI